MSRATVIGLLSVVALLVIFGTVGKAQDLKSAYTTPITAPFYLGPPVQYQDCKMLLIIFQTTPEVMKQLVHEPLKPDKRNLMFAYIGILNITKPIALTYNEAGIGALVNLSDKPGKYVAYMYLDKAAAISSGREVSGFPKKDAQITFKRSEKSVIGEVVRGGTTLIKAKLNITKRLDSVPPMPATPWYNLKLIPSVKKNAKPDVMQLTSIPSNAKRKDVHVGSGELEFGSSPADPLGKIKVGKIVLSQFYLSDMVLEHGDVVHDYLKE